MKNQDTIDSVFRNALANDHPSVEPRTGTVDRLNYYYTIKQPRQRVHTNSAAAMVTWLFSSDSLGLKAGVVTACLAGCLIWGNVKNVQPLVILADTCHVNTHVCDSNLMVKDTVMR